MMEFLNGINVGIIIILLGLYGVLTRKNLIKMIMSLYIMNSGVILVFVSLGYVAGGRAAIYGDGGQLMVDPLPQAVMLTTIVIGLVITALGLALALKIQEKYRTLDVRKLIEKEK
ncbi:sodium:proton antiporter [Candidatus Margulisiibacteriota bacterium]